jgi:hypothetical protein
MYKLNTKFEEEERLNVNLNSPEGAAGLKKHIFASWVKIKQTAF